MVSKEASVRSEPVEFAKLTAAAVFSDQRGRFVTPWDSPFDVPEFSPQSVHFSHNSQLGTLRGLHYAAPPFEQAKLVHCVRGSLFDVVVDMREKSPTFRAWDSFELDAGCGKSIWIPSGYAHGFLTLEPETIVCYLIAGKYHPDETRGIRWNDPAINIQWPAVHPLIISERDCNLPDIEL